MPLNLLLDDQDPTQRTYFLEEGGEFFLHQHTPGHIHQAILDQCAVDRAEGFNPKAVGRLAARIPIQMRNDWRKEWEKSHSDTFTWHTFLVSRINSSDYSKLRMVNNI